MKTPDKLIMEKTDIELRAMYSDLKELDRTGVLPDGNARAFWREANAEYKKMLNNDSVFFSGSPFSIGHIANTIYKEIARRTMEDHVI